MASENNAEIKRKAPVRALWNGGAFALALVASTTPAFAKGPLKDVAPHTRLLAKDVVADMRRNEQDVVLNHLGVKPVLKPGEKMTRPVAEASVAALTTADRVDGRIAPAVLETLVYLGAQKKGGKLESELAAAPREAGEPGWVDVTADVEAVQPGQQIPNGVKVYVRANAFDAARQAPGMTFGKDGKVSFDNRRFVLEGAASNATVLEIKEVDTLADGAQNIHQQEFFDACGNMTAFDTVVKVAPPPPEAPCVPHAPDEAIVYEVQNTDGRSTGRHGIAVFKNEKSIDPAGDWDKQVAEATDYARNHNLFDRRNKFIILEQDAMTPDCKNVPYEVGCLNENGVLGELREVDAVDHKLHHITRDNIGTHVLRMNPEKVDLSK